MNDFQFIIKLIQDKSGICIDESKEYLIETRLKPIARKNNLGGVSELIQKIKTTNDTNLINESIDAMTTNESLFFRDQKPFDQLRDLVLPALDNRPIKIWSAAASTGQEIYSTVITLEENNFSSYEILGTDISPSVIERSKEAKYSQFEVQRGMPITMLLKYFVQEGESWIVKPEYKTKTKFKTFNLIDNYTSLGTFDIIFCRNVLIYFDQETKREIYDKLHAALKPDGFLFLGSAETVINNTDKFEAVPENVGLFKPVH